MKTERRKTGNAEERKLVEFFRSSEGSFLASAGDADNISPADCAIRAMRRLNAIAPGPLAVSGEAPVISVGFVDRDAYGIAAIESLDEVRRARSLWPNKAGSAHEQFAVTDEEIDELLDAAGIERIQALLDARGRLWGHVKVNQKRRNLPEMRKEALQVAAMAIRFAAECCDEKTGRK
jgi:hypothetical protein